MNTSRSVLVTHPTGNENVRRLLTALVREQLLREFRTTVGFGAAGGDVLLRRLLGATAAKRGYPMVPDAMLRQHRLRELLRNGLLRVPLRAARRSAEGEGPFNVDWVARGLDSAGARSLGGAGVLYGYSGFTPRSAAAARAAGVPVFIEAQHALWRATERIAAAERARSPEWAATIPPMPDSRKRDGEDRELASATVAVSPSNQVSDSIRAAHPDLRILQAPYGCPAPVPAGERPSGGGRPRVLFVGRIVALKGVADLDHLVRALGDRVSVTVIGPAPNLRSAALDGLLSRVDYRGTMPRLEVLREMRTHDLLVAPSLVEGRSLSVLEAVSQGTPIVVTPGTGADDLAAAGAGTVVPIAQPQQLVDAVEQMIADPAALRERREAVLEVASAHGWQRFEEPVVAELRRVLADG